MKTHAPAIALLEYEIAVVLEPALRDVARDPERHEALAERIASLRQSVESLKHLENVARLSEVRDDGKTA